MVGRSSIIAGIASDVYDFSRLPAATPPGRASWAFAAFGQFIGITGFGIALLALSFGTANPLFAGFVAVAGFAYVLPALPLVLVYLFVLAHRRARRRRFAVALSLGLAGAWLASLALIDVPIVFAAALLGAPWFVVFGGFVVLPPVKGAGARRLRP